MGKFFDALKKSARATDPFVAEEAEIKTVGMRHEDIDVLMLGKERLEKPEPNEDRCDDSIDPRLVCLQDPNSPAAESFKILRSKLIANSSRELRRAIMITSSEPEDGKSLVAANLALSIARGINHHVLLMDTDLRVPQLHSLLGIQAKHGLREYLTNGSTLAPYLFKTPARKLTLLPAGRPSESPSELLSSEKMRQLVTELKGRYPDRFLILDSPPINFVAETASLTAMVDAVILVVRSGKTARESTQNAITTIGRERILGVVFNASEEAQKDFRLYYRYYQKGK